MEGLIFEILRYFENSIVPIIKNTWQKCSPTCTCTVNRNSAAIFKNVFNDHLLLITDCCVQQKSRG